VLDNLSTHSAGALYQAFPPAEARRVLRRLEFHLLLGVLRSQCFDRRIGDREQIATEIAA
jgi:hypothetical protein